MNCWRTEAGDPGPVEDVDPRHLVAGSWEGGLAQVLNVLASAVAAHRLQGACGVPIRAQCQLPQRPFASLEALGWDPAVEQAVRVVRVLGLVDDIGRGVYRHRLVSEPPKELERDIALAHVGDLARRVDLEHIAMVLGESARGELFGLLAGQPRVPRGLSSCTVVAGAGDACVLAETVAVGVDLDGGGASSGADVIGQAGQGWHTVRLYHVGPCGGYLVVVHQRRARATGEDPGAIRVAGRLHSVRHVRDAALGDELVREPGRQGQNTCRVGNQVAVPDRRTRSGDCPGDPR